MFVESSFMEERGQARFNPRVPTPLPNQSTSTVDGTSHSRLRYDFRILAAFSDVPAIVVRRATMTFVQLVTQTKTLGRKGALLSGVLLCSVIPAKAEHRVDVGDVLEIS